MAEVENATLGGVLLGIMLIPVAWMLINDIRNPENCCTEKRCGRCQKRRFDLYPVNGGEVMWCKQCCERREWANEAC